MGYDILTDVSNVSLDTNNTKSYSLQELYKILQLSSATVEVYDSVLGPKGLGSGFIIDEEGILVTNYHAAKPPQIVKLIYHVTFANGDVFHAGLVGADPFTDLAVLKIENSTFKKFIPDAIKQEYQGKTTKLGLNLKAYENPYFGIMNIKLPTNWLTSENQTTLKISPSEDKIEQNAQILLNSYYFDGRTMEDILTDFYNRNLGFITESRPITLNSKYESHLFTLTSYYQGTNIPFDKRLVIFIASPTTSENTYYYVIEYFSSAKTFEKYLSSAISIIKSITFGNPVEKANIKGFIKSSPL